MKKIFLNTYQNTTIFFLFFFFSININAQINLSQNERDCIEKERKYVKKTLDSIRIRGGFITYTTEILYCIPNRIKYSADSNYKDFNNRLIYNKELTDRVLELLNNKWDKWELDIVVQNHIERIIPSSKVIAEKIARVDTIRSYTEILDSILNSKKRIFKDEYINNLPGNYSSFVKLASYIDDSRFKKPIEEKYKIDPEFYSICLARMKIEPYLSTETKKLYKFLKGKEYWEINESVNGNIRTQESLKILSKCLLINFVYNPYSEGNYQQPFYRDAAKTLLFLLANDEVRELYSEEERKSFNYPNVQFEPFTKEHAKRLYDWMQKNYGKYKIRPF